MICIRRTYIVVIKCTIFLIQSTLLVHQNFVKSLVYAWRFSSLFQHIFSFAVYFSNAEKLFFGKIGTKLSGARYLI